MFLRYTEQVAIIFKKEEEKNANAKRRPYRFLFLFTHYSKEKKRYENLKKIIVVIYLPLLDLLKQIYNFVF